MKERQCYSGGTLDRAALLRRDGDWVKRQLQAAESRFLPLWRSRNLVSGNRQSSLVLWQRPALSTLLARVDEPVLLGVDAGCAYFALDLTELNEREAGALAASAAFCDLRHHGSMMRHDEAALAAYARAILRWHRHSRYCGYCGSATESEYAGAMRRCGNAACAREHFPRTDPAVIMLVVQDASGGMPARCLLANHHRSAAGSYSTLAGFVEPGESLEDAVTREVHEEVGLELESVVYQGSQPWPFPAAIMLGFHATTRQSEFRIDPGELGAAGWFTAQELDGFGEWGDESAERRLPPHDSIARDLIDSWGRKVRQENG